MNAERRVAPEGRPPMRLVLRRRRALVLGFFSLLALGQAVAQPSAAGIVSSFSRRGRAVQDVIVDRRGTVHIAWTVRESGVHDPGTLFYSRIDRAGTSTAESQISKFGGTYDARLDIGPAGRPCVLYRQMKRLYIACFNAEGTMVTPPSNELIPEEADARFEWSRDGDDNLYIFGRGPIDYFWKVDPSGRVLESRRGRWLRQPTPGFVCSVLNPGMLLFLWPSRRDSAGRWQGRSINMTRLDLASFSQGALRELDLSRVAEAREEGIELASPHQVRSGNDVLLLTSLTDAAGSAHTFRVRFNARGEPVRRWDLKRLYHVEAENAGTGECDYRVGVLRVRREGAKAGALEGIGRDGNIYHLNADIPALRAR